VAASAQIVSYRTEEEYCAANPNALPSCKNGKPYSAMEAMQRTYKQMEENQRGLLHPDNTRGPRTTVIPQTAHPAAKALSLAASWSFAHPNADLLMAIRASALRESPILQDMLAQLPPALQADAQKIGNAIRQLGEVDQAWLSTRSGDYLLLLQGRLNLPAGFVAAGNGMTSYRISSTAVVLGPGDSVAHAVERLAAQQGPPSKLARRIAQLAATNEICMSGTRALLDARAGMAKPGMSQAGASQAATSKLSNDLTGFSLGLGLRNELKLDLLLDYASLSGAQHALAEAREKPSPAGSSVHVAAQLEGTSVRMTLAIERAELTKAMHGALAGPLGNQLSILTASPALAADTTMAYKSADGTKQIAPGGQMVPPTADAHGKPGDLVIYGLQGGPKEIPAAH
jgi:hypothetical protein